MALYQELKARLLKDNQIRDSETQKSFFEAQSLRDKVGNAIAAPSGALKLETDDSREPMLFDFQPDHHGYTNFKLVLTIDADGIILATHSFALRVAPAMGAGAYVEVNGKEVLGNTAGIDSDEVVQSIITDLNKRV